ncbi:MAG: aspartate/glutamate racemase family protein [Saprospiraceae bacterium]|nr:aspartate/glutamate racemase family protein [Saprospiraceae bacterium]
MIGIVGGIGPLAGADLYKKIVEHTIARTDQDHLPVLLASLPGEIVDRTSYLLGKSNVNPAAGLGKVIRMLEAAGATLIGIACNTAHAPAIFNPMQEWLEAQESKVSIIHLIDQTIRVIEQAPLAPQRVGILSTTGAYHIRLYQAPLEQAGFEPVTLSFEQNEQWVHDAIFQIKASADTVPESVVFQLNTAIAELEAKGAQALILGCTEIGMIEKHLDFLGLPVFNPNTILARKLISLEDASKLKPQEVIAFQDSLG